MISFKIGSVFSPLFHSKLSIVIMQLFNAKARTLLIVK